MTLTQTREELVRWLKKHGVKLVVMGAGTDEYDAWIEIHVQTPSVIGSTPLYEREKWEKKS